MLASYFCEISVFFFFINTLYTFEGDELEYKLKLFSSHYLYVIVIDRKSSTCI